MTSIKELVIAFNDPKDGIITPGTETIIEGVGNGVTSGDGNPGFIRPSTSLEKDYGY